MHPPDLKHLISDAPRVMVVDGSKLVRKLIADVLKRDLPNVQVIGCASIAEARDALEAGAVDLVTTSLSLPDGDGLTLARSVREAAGQDYVPVIVVSGDVQEEAVRRVTELGALAVFFCSPAGDQVRGVAWNRDGGWAAQ